MIPVLRRCAAAAALGIAVALAASCSAGQRAIAPGSPGQTRASVPAASANDELEELADRLQPAPGDVSHGSFSYVTTRSWPDLPTNGPWAYQRRILVEQSWRGPGGSGRLLTWNETAGCTPEEPEQRWTAGMPTTMLGVDQPSSDPETLRHQLLRDPSAQARDLIAVIFALAREQHLPQPVRAASLRLLATIPNLSLHYDVTDRAGRAGIAITHIRPDLASDGLKATLIVHPATGQILAWHEQAVDAAGNPQPWSPSGGYIVIIASERVADTESPYVGCRDATQARLDFPASRPPPTA